jgi:F-type H+-transporting ATPase subunit epsilon
MAKPLNVEIISPSGYLFNGTCNMAVIPATNGEMGIMEGHEALITSLKEGKISIYDDKENIVNQFEVSAGFVEVLEDKLLALVETLRPSPHPFSDPNEKH